MKMIAGLNGSWKIKLELKRDRKNREVNLDRGENTLQEHQSMLL